MLPELSSTWMNSQFWMNYPFKANCLFMIFDDMGCRTIVTCMSFDTRYVFPLSQLKEMMYAFFQNWTLNHRRNMSDWASQTGQVLSKNLVEINMSTSDSVMLSQPLAVTSFKKKWNERRMKTTSTNNGALQISLADICTPRLQQIKYILSLSVSSRPETYDILHFHQWTLCGACDWQIQNFAIVLLDEWVKH